MSFPNVHFIQFMFGFCHVKKRRYGFSYVSKGRSLSMAKSGTFMLARIKYPVRQRRDLRSVLCIRDE